MRQDPRSPPVVQLRQALLAAVGLLVIGTMGYMLIADAQALDAFLMTVVTVSTVGYRDVVLLESTASKLFTIGLILSALVITAFVVRNAAELALTDVFGLYMGRRRMQKRIDELKDHTIVCGCGRMGRGVVAELEAEGRPYAIIEADEATATEVEREGRLVVWGDATRDRTLKRAGIDRAKSVVAVAESDSENLMIALSCRALKPGIRIVTRAEMPDAIKKLRRAGADYVLQYYGTSAMHMALAITHPVVEEVLERLIPRHGDLDLGQIEIEEGAFLDGRRLSAIGEQGCRALVLAVAKDEAVELPPRASVPVTAGDVLVVAGAPGALKQLKDLAKGEAVSS